jgi:broad specificity phosphatase PhoE
MEPAGPVAGTPGFTADGGRQGAGPRDSGIVGGRTHTHRLCQPIEAGLGYPVDHSRGAGIETIACDSLKEIRLGPWEGKTHNETVQSDPLETVHFWSSQDRFNLPGAESYVSYRIAWSPN